MGQEGRKAGGGKESGKLCVYKTSVLQEGQVLNISGFISIKLETWT